MLGSILQKKTKSEITVHALFFIFFALVAISYIVIFIVGFIQGFKTHKEVVMHPFSWPTVWHPRNYLDVFMMLEVNNVNMIGMIFNSLFMMLVGGTFSILASALMAYCFVKYKFVGKRLWMAVNIVTIMIPIMGNLGSAYRIYSALGFINSRFYVLTFWGGFGTNTLFMCAFFRNLSDCYKEAAEIDGANGYVILFRIILSLARGPILALGIIAATGIWNDYMGSLLFFPKIPTLATGLYLFKAQMTYKARMDILMAGTMLSSIPILAIYIIFNKTILTNVSMGGLKG